MGPITTTSYTGGISFSEPEVTETQFFTPALSLEEVSVEVVSNSAQNNQPTILVLQELWQKLKSLECSSSRCRLLGWPVAVAWLIASEFPESNWIPYRPGELAYLAKVSPEELWEHLEGEIQLAQHWIDQSKVRVALLERESVACQEMWSLLAFSPTWCTRDDRRDALWENWDLLLEECLSEEAGVMNPKTHPLWCSSQEMAIQAYAEQGHLQAVYNGLTTLDRTWLERSGDFLDSLLVTLCTRLAMQAPTSPAEWHTFLNLIEHCVQEPALQASSLASDSPPRLSMQACREMLPLLLQHAVTCDLEGEGGTHPMGITQERQLPHHYTAAVCKTAFRIGGQAWLEESISHLFHRPSDEVIQISSAVLSLEKEGEVELSSAFFTRMEQSLEQRTSILLSQISTLPSSARTGLLQTFVNSWMGWAGRGQCIAVASVFGKTQDLVHRWNLLEPTTQYDLSVQLISEMLSILCESFHCDEGTTAPNPFAHPMWSLQPHQLIAGDCVWEDLPHILELALQKLPQDAGEEELHIRACLERVHTSLLRGITEQTEENMQTLHQELQSVVWPKKRGMSQSDYYLVLQARLRLETLYTEIDAFFQWSATAPSPADRSERVRALFYPLAVQAELYMEQFASCMHSLFIEHLPPERVLPLCALLTRQDSSLHQAGSLLSCTLERLEKKMELSLETLQEAVNKLPPSARRSIFLEIVRMCVLEYRATQDVSSPQNAARSLSLTQTILELQDLAGSWVAKAPEEHFEACITHLAAFLRRYTGLKGYTEEEARGFFAHTSWRNVFQNAAQDDCVLEEITGLINTLPPACSAQGPCQRRLEELQRSIERVSLGGGESLQDRIKHLAGDLHTVMQSHDHGLPDASKQLMRALRHRCTDLYRHLKKWQEEPSQETLLPLLYPWASHGVRWEQQLLDKLEEGCPARS